MENSLDMTNAQEETLQEVMEPQTEQAAEPQNEQSLSPQDQLNKLIEARTGIFETALDLEDLKWLRNQCNSKFTFKGPNDAFMLMNAYIGLDAAISHWDHKNKEAVTSKLTASTVEALAILMNRYEGTGTTAAQRVFKIAVALQNVIARFKEMDKEIELLEGFIKSENEAQSESEPESDQQA